MADDSDEPTSDRTAFAGARGGGVGGGAACSACALAAVRCVAAAVAVLFAALLVATVRGEGSPFYWRVLYAPWMRTTLVDYYLTLAPLAAAAAWRERRAPAWAALTVLFFCCLGSTAVWAYIFLAATRMRAGDAVARVLA